MPDTCREQHGQGNRLVTSLSEEKGFLHCMKASLLGVCLCLNLVISPAHANPVLNTVEAGNATVQQTATTTTVNQQSDRAILNWHSFNIGKGEITRFVQPSSSAIALNRIDPTQGASQIFGTLTANGRLILVNQAGIFFGPGSRVDVAGLIASTSGI